MPEPTKLAVRSKVAYGIGSTAEHSLTVIFMTFNFFFYNSVLGLSGTLCGLAVAVAMVVDAFSDPLVGVLSDRWRSRLGRRHPFLYASAIPAVLCFVAIYSPPVDLGQWALFAWFTVFTILLRTAMTFYYVPHLALGAEMTTDYVERSVLMSYNTILGLIGTAGISYLSWQYFGMLEQGSSDRHGYFVLTSAIGVFAALAFLASAFFTRDQIPRLSQVPANVRPFSLSEMLSEARDAFQNRNYRLLLAGIVALAATLGLNETLGTHLNLFFWQLDENQIKVFSPAGLPGLVLAAILTPRLHVWFEKRETLIAGILGMTLAASLPVALRLLGWFPETGSPWLFPALIGFKVISYATSAMMVISLVSTLADVTDEHELETGRRQEGFFFAARSFFSKLTSGLGHLLAGGAMDLIGFPAGAAREAVGTIPPDVLFQFGVVAGPLSQIPGWIAVFFYARYGIDKARHREIREQLDLRKAADEGAASAAQ